MRRASTHTSHTQSHFPHIPLRPTEPKPLTQNYIRVFALPSELQHLSKLEVFETSTRHPCIFNELIFFYKDKIIILNYQMFFFCGGRGTRTLVSNTPTTKDYTFRSVFSNTPKFVVLFFTIVRQPPMDHSI